MLLVRRLGAVILSVAAIAVWFLMEPNESSDDAADYSVEISDAMDSYEANNAMADSAPQQEVVNGWVAKDLLEVVAKAENAALSPKSAPRDDRVPAELMLAVLGLGLLALTTPTGSASDGSGRSTSELPPSDSLGSRTGPTA
jgi:hypothetical protein